MADTQEQWSGGETTLFRSLLYYPRPVAGSVGGALCFVETPPNARSACPWLIRGAFSFPLRWLSRAASWQRGPSSLSQQEDALP